MQIEYFFHPTSSTLTYLIYSEISKTAVIIDPVLDFDPTTNKVKDNHLKALLDRVSEKSLKPAFLLETHIHADHISASYYLKKLFPTASIGLGQGVEETQALLIAALGLNPQVKEDLPTDLFLKSQILTTEDIRIQVIETPGHTRACVCYLIDGHLFTGDCLFMPDFGTGRCDFPGGSASDLYDSIKKLYDLPGETKVYVGHDYQPNGRELRYSTTINEESTHNIHLKRDTTKAEFVEFRQTRDKTLSEPKLLRQAIPLNLTTTSL